MKIVQLEQGSPEWLSWRCNKRMASEASVVTGRNPWQKPRQLAMVKRGLASVKMNGAMARGHKYEPAARAFFEAELGLLGNPVVIEEGDYGASLDWAADDWSAIAEFKVPASENSELWQSACKGEIPVYYLDQIAMQMHVSGCGNAYFCVYLPELETGKVIKVPSLQGRAEEICAAWDAFWAEYMVGEWQDDERTDQDWFDAAERYRVAKMELDRAQAKIDEAKKELIELAPAGGYGCGIKVSKVDRAGSVQYAKLVKDLKIPTADIEKYRGSGTSYFTVDFLNKE